MASPLLDRAPFQAWLIDYVEKCGGPQAAAQRLQMNTQQLVLQLESASQRVNLSHLDRFFTAAGEPHMLALLYPLNVETTERHCDTCDEMVTVAADNRCPWCEGRPARRPARPARRPARTGPRKEHPCFTCCESVMVANDGLCPKCDTRVEPAGWLRGWRPRVVA